MTQPRNARVVQLHHVRLGGSISRLLILFNSIMQQLFEYFQQIGWIDAATSSASNGAVTQRNLQPDTGKMKGNPRFDRRLGCRDLVPKAKLAPSPAVETAISPADRRYGSNRFWHATRLIRGRNFRWWRSLRLAARLFSIAVINASGPTRLLLPRPIGIASLLGAARILQIRLIVRLIGHEYLRGFVRSKHI
jgi:hypothetical protein